MKHFESQRTLIKSPQLITKKLGKVSPAVKLVSHTPSITNFLKQLNVERPGQNTDSATGFYGKSRNGGIPP